MKPLGRRIDHDRLSRICFIDYDRELGLVAEYKDPETGRIQLLGVGRLIKLSCTDTAEFSVIVSDVWHGRGIGTKLLQTLIDVGPEGGLKRITGTILLENYCMIHVCKKLGFETKRLVEDPVVEVALLL